MSIPEVKCVVSDEHFGKETKTEDVGDYLFDLVLLSHCLYCDWKKEATLEAALQFVSPGGILIVFHRWDKTDETITQLTNYLTEKQLLHNIQAIKVTLDLSSIASTDRERVSRYTKDSFIPTEKHNFINRSFGVISIEPHACNLANKVTTKTKREKIQRQVCFDARTKIPAAVVSPRTTVGVQSCLYAASQKICGGGNISVVGGGHSAQCLDDNVIAIDMGAWQTVCVDVSTKTVRVGGGATTGIITEECGKYGLVVPLGDRPGVGMGLILQGGINHFMRRFGLVCDSILRVVCVSPTGEVQIAEGPELWHFQGAGTNFGVILEVTLQGYELPTVRCQTYEYTPSGEDYAWMVSRYEKASSTLPCTAALDGYMFWKSSSDLGFATSLFDTDVAQRRVLDYSGLIQGRAGVKSELLSTACKPSELFDKEFYMSAAFAPEAATAQGDTPPKKLRSVKKCVFLKTIQRPDLLETCTRRAPTKWCYVHFLQGGGRVCELDLTSTAFGCRDWNFAAVLTACYPDGSCILRSECEKWLQSCVASLSLFIDGVYASDLGPADSDLAMRAFGPNRRRLAEAKRRLDPLNLFDCDCPLLGNDTNSSSQGVVVVFCGHRCARKDWLAEQVALELSSSSSRISVEVVRSSDVTKRDYAHACGDGVDTDRLIHDRDYKEQHRPALTAYYDRQRAQNPACDAQSYQELVDASTADIVFVTGMRHGLESVQTWSSKPTVIVHVVAPHECKQTRAEWVANTAIDDVESTTTCTASSVSSVSCYDCTYHNDDSSTTETAHLWAWQELLPRLVRSCIREFKGVPIPGVVYKDIVGGLLGQPFGLRVCNDLFARRLDPDTVDLLVAPGDTGFVFASSVASHFQKPLVLVSKAKGGGQCIGLPPMIRTTYDGSNISRLIGGGGGGGGVRDHHVLEMISGSIQPGQRVVMVDDCLASGATAPAVRKLVHLQGGFVALLLCVMEIGSDCRRSSEWNTVDIQSLVQYEGV